MKGVKEVNRKMFEALRQHHKLTQQEFARALGVSSSTVDSIETGRRPLSRFVRGKVAASFELDEDFLRFYHNYEKL